MASPEVERLVKYVQALILATKSGDVAWSRINPTTFVWEVTAPHPARLTLQVVDRPVIQRNAVGGVVRKLARDYSLILLDTKSGETRLSAEGKSDSDVDVVLRELFRTISSGISEKGLDFLGSIVPHVPEK